MITFDIKFNEIIFLEQHRLRIKLLFKKTFRKIRNFGIFGLVLLSLGLIAGTDDKVYFNPFTIMGMVMLSIDFLIGLIFLLIYRNSLKAKDTVIKEIIENKYDSHYDFSEDAIKYTDKIKQFEFKWEGVKGYTIVNENIFIMHSNSIYHSLIIGKNEVNEDVYEKIVEILKSKVKYIETIR